MQRSYVGKEGIAAVNLGLPVIYLYLGIMGTFLWREAAGIRPASGSKAGDLPR